VQTVTNKSSWRPLPGGFLDDFQILLGTSLPTDTLDISSKIFMKIPRVLPLNTSQLMGKKPHLQCWWILQKPPDIWI